jgi:beta-galactosidase
MKHFWLAGLLATMTGFASASQPWWQDHTVFGVNKLAPHASLFHFDNREAALRGDRSSSPWYQSLDGDWKFHWAHKPADAPNGIEDPQFDDADWDTIRVPGNWESSGFGQAIYLDERYPFEAQWPQVPEDYNPVGSYRRQFVIPASWQGRRIRLHFGGVRSALSVWVNGAFTGYSQGAKTPAEFDITDQVRTGTRSAGVTRVISSPRTCCACPVSSAA